MCVVSKIISHPPGWVLKFPTGSLDCSSNASNEWHWFPPWTQPAATSNMFNAWNFGPPTGAYTNPARNPQFLIKSAFPTLAPKWIWNEREIQKINPRPPTLILDGHDPAWPPGKNRTHIIGPPHQCTIRGGGNHRTRRHTRVHNRYPCVSTYFHGYPLLPRDIPWTS